MQRAPVRSDERDPSEERIDPADAFVFQDRKHLSIFVMLMLGLIPLGIALGRPWNIPVSIVWLCALVGWYMVRGFRFRHRGRRYSYTISGGKHGPKYITDLETGEVIEAHEFMRQSSFPHVRTLILGLVMPMVLLACMFLCGIAYLWLRVHMR